MDWREYLAAHRARFVDELLDFVRIPSVSADPALAADVARAAEWVAARCRAAGLEEARVLQTGGHPVVLAHWLHAGPDRPTILIYGHFDVQPAEPLDLWTSPPFAPEIRDGRVWGRGASDDKGSMLTPILALEAMLETAGRLPVNVKVFFEGQEEIGSPELPAVVAAHRGLLACDMIFSADGLQWSADTPMLVTGLKGLVSAELVVEGPRADQHSGLHGGGIANPALALAQILASMNEPDGRIGVAGFHDDVIPLSDEDRAEIAAAPFDETGYLAETGAPGVHGEPGYTTRERLWARPTLDVNGLTSGWQGAGTKTVLPARASAKITCRLVADQSPGRVFDALAAHVAAHCPPGVVARLDRLPGSGEPFLLPRGHSASRVAGNVLAEIYGRAPLVTRLGGSIPVMTILKRELGVHGVMFGFSVGDENLHAPDEFFRLASFDRGQAAYARLLERLGA